MPTINFSIRVVKRNGEGARGVTVGVHYATTFHRRRTDEDGWAEFSKSNILNETLSATVFVNGEEVGEIHIEDGDTFSFDKP